MRVFEITRSATICYNEDMKKRHINKVNVVLFIWLTGLTIALGLVIAEHLSYMRATQDAMDSLSQQIFQLQIRERE